MKWTTQFFLLTYLVSACSNTQFTSQKTQGSSLTTSATPAAGNSAPSDDDQISNAVPPSNVMGGYLTCEIVEETAAGADIGCIVLSRTGERFSNAIKSLKVYIRSFDGVDTRIDVAAAGKGTPWHFVGKISSSDLKAVASIFAVGVFDGLESSVTSTGDIHKRSEPSEPSEIVPSPFPSDTTGTATAVDETTSTETFTSTKVTTGTGTADPAATAAPTAVATIAPKKKTIRIRKASNFALKSFIDAQLSVTETAPTLSTSTSQVYSVSTAAGADELPTVNVPKLACGPNQAMRNAIFVLDKYSDAKVKSGVECIEFIDENDAVIQLVTTNEKAYVTRFPITRSFTISCGSNEVLVGASGYDVLEQATNYVRVETYTCARLPTIYKLSGETAHSSTCRSVESEDEQVSIGFKFGTDRISYPICNSVSVR